MIFAKKILNQRILKKIGMGSAHIKDRRSNEPRPNKIKEVILWQPKETAHL